MVKTSEAAKGKWKGILEALGVDPKYLRDVHGPCPICGGKDRFRWDNKDDEGTYYCSGCGPGVGIHLLQKLHGWDFLKACQEVDAVVGNVEIKIQREERTEEEKRLAIKRVLSSARKVKQGDPVWSYLEKRCGRPDLEMIKDIRYHPGMTHPAAGGLHPCMLSMLRFPDRSGATVQRLFLAAGGQKADVQPVRMLMPGSIKGACVMLGEPAEQMGIAEGIETAICASNWFGIPVWAAISANGLMDWQPPEIAKSIIICGDNDANYTGHVASYTLARRLVLKGYKVEVQIPQEIGLDWCDVTARDLDK